MSKNLLLGTILGGAATYVAWKCLSDKQKNDIKKNVGSYVTEVADASTDYALNALDIIDFSLSLLCRNKIWNQRPYGISVIASERRLKKPVAKKRTDVL